MATSADNQPSRRPARFYEFGPFRIDRQKRVLLRGAEPIPLTPKAFDTLLVLVEVGSDMLTKDQLLREPWPDTFVEEGSLTRNISALRKALGESPQDHRYIVTIPGQGYRFVAKVTPLFGETGSLTFVERTRTSVVVTEQTDDGGTSSLEAADGVAAPASRSLRGGRRPFRPVIVFVAILLIAMGATAFITYKLFTSGPNSKDPTRATTPSGLDIVRLTATGNIMNGRAAISPDGKFVAYAVMDSA